MGVTEEIFRDPAPFSIMVIGGNRGSHVVATYKLGDGKLLLFDPNLGEFYIPSVRASNGWMHEIVHSVYLPIGFDRGYVEHYWGREVPSG